MIIEKTVQVDQVVLVPACDGCKSEDVTVNDGSRLLCDSCFKKTASQPASVPTTAPSAPTGSQTVVNS